MGIRKIIWSKRAIRQFNSAFRWYRDERGNQFSMKFFNGIIDTIETLSNMPSIGRLDDSYGGKESYYSFLAHPKYRIVYRYTNTTLYIVAIRATMMSY